MSVIFEGVDMPKACCSCRNEDVEYCFFYNVCKQRNTIKTNYKPDNCPLRSPERTGHWIPLGNYDDWGNENSYKCSECGEVDTYPDNFCFNCGSYNGGEK